MTYERDRLNRVDAEETVILKKSSLTAMIIGAIIMVAVICGLGWQNYQQQQQINNLSNPNVRTMTVTHQSSQPYQQQ